MIRYASGMWRRKGIVMKYNVLRKLTVTFILAVAGAAVLTGCGKKEDSGAAAVIITAAEQGSGDHDTPAPEQEPAGTAALEVRFGDDGDPFVMELENNTTAAAIAKHVGTADWRLPIYHYDDYENWEVMQYYDIPSRYEIPSNAETVTSETAGEVYYSEPNRIILFYQDGEVSGEYTKIGTIENTDEFRDAVESNPVLEGWGNKIVLIEQRGQ